MIAKIMLCRLVDEAPRALKKPLTRLSRFAGFATLSPRERERYCTKALPLGEGVPEIRGRVRGHFHA
jgi:hypothetical protein